MKNLIIILLSSIAIFSQYSCDLTCGDLILEECDDHWGWLTVENKSRNTIHQILIDNTNYGSIDPEECKEIELPVGKYTLEFRGIDGGAGCSRSEITIPDCNGVIRRSCSS